MKKLISEINSILSQKLKINTKDKCLYGFSGGQDSVLLFIILLHLKKQWNIEIQLLHFHHFWQQKNFFSTYQVWQLSFVFKNPIYIITSSFFLDSEKKARKWRQEGLERISCIEKSNKILLGHTASDRIETAFWHLIRGTSPQGLISLKWQTTLFTFNEFFSFPKFFIFHSFETKNSISSLSQHLKKINRKEGEIAKINHFYNKSKKKNKLKNRFCFASCKQTKLFYSSCFRENKIDCVIFSKSKDFVKGTNKGGPKSVAFWNGKGTNSVFFKKKQHTIACYLLFNFIFSNKLILRPLLGLHRNDVTFFSKKYFLPILCDPSNDNIRWSRNRIRHQLFPLLRFFFNPNTEYLLHNFLEISIEEQKYIESIMKKIIKSWLKNYQTSYYMKNQFQLFPKALQRRLLQKIFQSYTGLQPNLLQIEILRINIENHS